MVTLKDNSLNTLCRFKVFEKGNWLEMPLWAFLEKQSNNFSCYNYIPETFCLCVGINDKEQKVFEKDILRACDGNYGYRTPYDDIHDGYLYYIIPTIKQFTHGIINYPFDEFGSYLKTDDEYNTIIGNIFDNPELLSKITPNIYQLDDGVI